MNSPWTQSVTALRARVIQCCFINIFLVFLLTRLGFLFFLSHTKEFFSKGKRFFQLERTSPNEICDDTGPVLISSTIHIVGIFRKGKACIALDFLSRSILCSLRSFMFLPVLSHNEHTRFHASRLEFFHSPTTGMILFFTHSKLSSSLSFTHPAEWNEELINTH